MDHDPYWRVPRDSRSLFVEALRLGGLVSEIGDTWFPGQPPGTFLEEYVSPRLKPGEIPSGDEIGKRILETALASTEPIAVLPDIAVAALAYTDQAMHAHDAGKIEEAWTYICDAAYWTGILRAASTDNDATRYAISKMAQNAARTRYAKDPKQAAKLFVYECWQAWKAKPDLYKTATEFARDMLDKQPDLLSEVVVTRWVRKWAKVS